MKIGDFESLWQIALKNNPNQRVYNLNEEQLIFEYNTSKNFYYPQAFASFNGQDNLIQSVTPVPAALVGHPGSTAYLQFGKHYSYNTGLTLTKDLFDWQAILQSKIAKENIALNTVQQDAFLQTLKLKLGQYYYAALVAKKSIDIAEKDILVVDSIYLAIKQKFDEGLSDASAVNLAKINKNNVQQNIYQSEQLFNQAMANIKVLAGLSPEKTFILIPLDIENIPSRNINLNSDKTLVPYSTTITINELQIKEQKAKALPKITATGYFGFQEYRDRFEMSFTKNAWADYQYIGLGLNWPIFTGFANNNKLKSINTQKKIAEQNFKAAKDQSNINDILLIQNLNTFSALVTSSKNNFDLFGKNMLLSKQKFNMGLISVDIYLKTFQDYLVAENQYLNNLSSLLNTKAVIEARQ